MPLFVHSAQLVLIAALGSAEKNNLLFLHLLWSPSLLNIWDLRVENHSSSRFNVNSKMRLLQKQDLLCYNITPTCFSLAIVIDFSLCHCLLKKL